MSAIATILDGKLLAKETRRALKARVLALAERGVVPRLSVILVGEDPASQVYVRSKERKSLKLGMRSDVIRLPADTSQAALYDRIQALNADPSVHGVLVQLPLPKQIDEQAIIAAIDPAKDVDGFHPQNMGALLSGVPRLVPCTPLGIMRLLERFDVPIHGKHAVVVGRSNIVGKPVSLLLLAEHATVTICHSRTPDIATEVARADIVVAAVGRPRMIQGDWIRPGAAVIDVGINRLDNGTLCGDVDFDGAAARAGWITPVPGGVGLMTVAMLLANTIQVAEGSPESLDP